MKKTIALLVSKIFIFFYKLRYGRRIKFGKNVIINHKLRLSGKGKLIIGDDVVMWAHEENNRFNFYSPQAQIKIGNRAKLNGVFCHAYTLIEIGEDCMLGSATLMDTDFHTFDDPKHVLHGNELSKPIHIQKGVWLAGQSVILKGVTIGENSVVGFRGVVTKSFPANVVIAGNPGKVVKKL